MTSTEHDRSTTGGVPDGRVVSVNVGTVRPVPWGRLRRSGIDKRPVEGPVAFTAAGVGDDEIANPRYHGGPDQAVYAFESEDLASWSAELGREVAPGSFGENLTTAGIDLEQTRLGDRWRVGEALLEVTDVRVPCATFAGATGERAWVRRFAAAGRPGPYLRVLEPGAVTAGDVVRVVERRDHDLTVGLALRARLTERDLLPRLLEEPRIGARLRSTATRAARTAAG